MSNIEWTDETENPIRVKGGGHWCKKISPGCANCYAETINNSGFFGFASHLKYAGDPPEMELDIEMIAGWSRKKKPKKRFLCSVTDLFGEWVPEEWLDQIFAGMALAPSQTFQILTKRPEQMLEYFASSPDMGRIQRQMNKISPPPPYVVNFPLPNVWLGTTIENQVVTERARPLYELHNRGWKTFYSVEPLLEDVELYLNHERVDWVIVGGESGRNARPCDINWIRSIVRQCRDANVPVFVKQLGSNAYDSANSEWRRFGGKNNDIANFPSDLQIREMPQCLHQ